MAELSDFLEIEHIYSQTISKGLNTIAVSAANPGEGVSTVACALAKRHSHSGKKVLLVDMNYFRPSLDERFKMARQAWSIEDGTVHGAVLNDAASGVHILTASLNVDTQMRQRGGIQKALKEWESRFDVVVIDTSPLNSINRLNIPAEQLCALVRATVLVVRSACTKEADILEALAKLRSQQTEPLGWIMNDIDCPSLASEIKRELRRLARLTPKIARWLERKVDQNDIINQVV
jgi:Mrp family chromosome partitioning ATPase